MGAIVPSNLGFEQALCESGILDYLGWGALYCLAMENALIQSPLAILVTLTGITAFFFWLQQYTQWRFFKYFPPLVFIYAVPTLMSTRGWLVNKSPVYDWMSATVLPFLIVMLLLKVDLRSTVRVMGRGIVVMLCGTAGVMLGAPLAFLIVRSHLEPDTWKAFGALAGSWIGGTANMAAVGEGLEASGAHFGLAVLADNVIYMVWLPILLGSKNLSSWFHRWTRVDQKRLHALESIQVDTVEKGQTLAMHHVLYLLFLGFAISWLASQVAGHLPVLDPILTAGTWKILLVTSLGLLLSITPARSIPGSQELGIALVYLFVANMGARADLSEIKSQAAWFIVGAFLWISFHGLFCILAARIFHVDIHSTAIASAANVGAVASAPVVAAHHNPRLVPVSILMALLGYAVGNYGAFVAAWLCQLLA